MNIIITGGSFVNKGAEAMLRTVQAELARRIPGAAFYLWRLPEHYGPAAAGSGFLPVALPCERSGSSSGWEKSAANKALWSLKQLVRGRDPGPLAALFSKKGLFAAACRNFLDRTHGGFAALVDVSGFAYGDELGETRFRMVQPLLAYFTYKDRPAIFLPQAWGSFEKPGTRREVRRLLGGRKTVFYSRDETSCRFLEKALDRPAGSIRSYPDIVFGFQGGGEKQGREILAGMGCTMKRPIIGVAPNMRVFERLPGKGVTNPYLQSLVKLAGHCLDRHDVDIVLQANEIDSLGSRLDDRYLCGLVAAAVNRPDRCFWTREPLDAESTKALVGRFGFLIGSRFHSFVFGFSQGVSGLAVSWLHKYRELFAQFELGDRVQECRDLDADGLIAKFESAWPERKALEPRLLAKAERLRDEVASLFDEVAARIHES